MVLAIGSRHTGYPICSICSNHMSSTCCHSYLKKTSADHASRVRLIHEKVLDGIIHVSTVESYINLKEMAASAVDNCDKDTRKVLSNYQARDQVKLVTEHMHAFVSELASLKETIALLTLREDVQTDAMRRLVPANYSKFVNYPALTELYAVNSLPNLAEFDILYRSKIHLGSPSSSSKLLIKASTASRKYLEAYKTSKAIREHFSILYPGIRFHELESVEQVSAVHAENPSVLEGAYTLWRESESTGAYHLFADALIAMSLL